MIELFTADTPNGKKISIMLEEIKFDYKVTKVDLVKGEQFKSNFRKISPFSKIPVIIDHENEEKILEGSFDKSLMSTSNFKAQMEGIIDISVEKVYKSKEVIEKELTGYKVLNFLLKTFTNSVINWRDDKVSAFDELALECIPKEYLNKIKNNWEY